jgi:hypothetical protein
MSPLLAIPGVALAAYAVWRAFGPKSGHVPHAGNNWRNEDFVSREKNGTWSEGSTMASDSESPPHHVGLGDALT